MSTILSCIGRTERNWNTAIQLQSTYQFHPEACDKLCLSLVSDSGEIKIPLLQQGERWQCGSLCRGREGCAPAVCTGRQGKGPWHPASQEGAQPHGVQLGCSQIKGPSVLSLPKTVHRRLESSGRQRAEWHRGEPSRLGGSPLSWAALVGSSGWI